MLYLLTTRRAHDCCGLQYLVILQEVPLTLQDSLDAHVRKLEYGGLSCFAQWVASMTLYFVISNPHSGSLTLPYAHSPAVL